MTTLAKLTARAGSNIQDAVSDFNINEIPWTRAVAAGALLTGVCLLIAGKRKAALAVAATGTAVALMEDPAAIRKFWNDLPDYMQTGQKFLGRVEGFVEELAAQGENLRKTIGRIS